MKTTYPFSRDIVSEVLTRYYPGTHIYGGEVHGPTLPSPEEFADKVTEYLDAERQAELMRLAQTAKNASLGKTPEQVTETLKVQVNLGIGGLLAMLQRDRAVFSTLLMSKAGCTQMEIDAAFAAPSLAAVNALIATRLTYWQWIAAVDAEAQACIADPNRIPNFPAPPTL